MNQFVHSRLGRFLMEEADGEGNDLGGGLPDDDEQEEEEEEGAEDEEGEQGGEEEPVLMLDGKAVEEEDEGLEDGKPAPSWVKDLRKANREDKRRIRELEELVKKQQAPQQQAQAIVLGKKPSMEDDDIDWDAAKFEEKLEAWHERKRAIDQAERDQQQAEQKQQAEWQGRLEGYAKAKTGLKFKDFDDAEENVKSTLNVTQQGIIIQGADNSALVVYALGRNPKKAAELAAITDAVKFAFAIAKLETQLKVQTKKTAPPPEKTVTGQGRISGTTDSTLERLREEAMKTGDLSKVNAYKRDQKRKQKA